MDVDMEIDEVNLSEDQKNIIQNMSSLFPKEVTANFFSVLRNSLHGSKTLRKQSTLDGWLRKSASPKKAEMPSSIKQQNLPSTSSGSSEEENKQDSVGLGNSNNALQEDSSCSINKLVELDSAKVIMEPPTDAELVKRMFKENLIIELKRVEIGNLSVQEKLARITPQKTPDKPKAGREKVLNRNMNAEKQVIIDTNKPLNEMSTGDSGFGQGIKSPDLCEKVDFSNVNSLSSPKSKAKRLRTRKESNGLPDKMISNVEVCQDSSYFGENVESRPSSKNKAKRRCARKDPSSVNMKDGNESSDSSLAISHETEKGDSASLVGNLNNGTSCLGQSPVDSSPSPKKKAKRHYNKKESSPVNRKDIIKNSDASPAISDKPDKIHSASLLENVKVDHSSIFLSSAVALSSPQRKTKQQYNNKKLSSVSRNDGIESSNASLAISHAAERDNSASLVGNANDGNSSQGQSSAVPTKIGIRKACRSSKRMSFEKELTCSFSNDSEQPHFTAKEKDESNIMKSKTQSSRPDYRTASRRSRMKLKNGVDSANKSAVKDPCSLRDQPETVVIKQREKKSRALSKENASSSNHTRQDFSSIGPRIMLKNCMNSNNKSTENDQASLIGTVVKQMTRRSRTLSKETVNDSNRTRRGSSPIKSRENGVLESKSSSKISKRNKKSNQTSDKSGKTNEEFVSTERLDNLCEVVQLPNELVEATAESNDESSDVVNESTSGKTNTTCGDREVKLKASGKARKLKVWAKSNKKLEANNKKNKIIGDVIATSEIQEVNNSATEQTTKSKVDANMTKLNDVQTTDTSNRESEIKVPDQSIANKTSKAKRFSPCKSSGAAGLSKITGGAVLDCDLVKEECISEGDSIAGLNDLPEMEENGIVDFSESNKLTIKVQSIIRTIKGTTRINSRKAKKIRKSRCNSKLVDEQPQIAHSTPNQDRTVENETIPELVHPPATEKSTNCSITVEDKLCGEGSQTSSASAEKQKNLEQFCKMKEVCSSLNISMEQLFQNKKLTKQLKSPCKSDAYALISGHKLKNGQTLPSVFKVDSKGQLENFLRSYAAKR